MCLDVAELEERYRQQEGRRTEFGTCLIKLSQFDVVLG